MFDLDAAYAAQREAARSPFEFTYGGEKFTVPLSDEWPIEASTVVSKGDLLGGMRLILDVHEAGQADRFLACNPSLGHLKLIFDEESKYENVGGLPNSAASRRPGSTPT